MSCPPHYWIIDSKNFGRCKNKGCGATKQFPVEELTTFTKNERTWIEHFNMAYSADIHHVNIPGFSIPSTI